MYTFFPSNFRESDPTKSNSEMMRLDGVKSMRFSKTELDEGRQPPSRRRMRTSKKERLEPQSRGRED